MKSTGVLSSNQVQWPDFGIGNQQCSSSNGHQGDVRYWVCLGGHLFPSLNESVCMCIYSFVFCVYILVMFLQVLGCIIFICFYGVYYLFIYLIIYLCGVENAWLASVLDSVVPFVIVCLSLAYIPVCWGSVVLRWAWHFWREPGCSAKFHIKPWYQTWPTNSLDPGRFELNFG